MQAIGEVLTSNITGFSAESWADQKHDESQAKSNAFFGGFLKSRSEDKQLSVIGVVYDIVTGAKDLHHKPTALKMSRAELKREQPQIFTLLKTEWHLAAIGFIQSGNCRSGLPPFPPEVHDFVYPLEKDELIQITDSLEFLRTIFALPGIPTDELLAAAIRTAARARNDDYKYLVDAGQHLSQFYRDDFERLGSVLRKIKP